MRLDRFLAEPLGSRARAQALIDAGPGHASTAGRAPSATRSAPASVIVVDARADAARRPLRAGGRPSRSPTRTSTCWSSTSRPAWSCTRPAVTAPGTLAQALAGRAAGGEEPWRAGIVHRLDRDTSGLLVVAKSDEVHRALKALLAARGLRREYLALVDGRPPARTGTIDAPIGRHRRDRVLMSIDTDEPREARTHFEIERLLPRATLLRVVLDTGRTHQIRVHLAAIGHPVCGDPQYGTAGEFGLERQFLHAARLAFTHPVTGEAVDVSSPLPEDLAAALAGRGRGRRGATAAELGTGK